MRIILSACFLREKREVIEGHNCLYLARLMYVFYPPMYNIL